MQFFSCHISFQRQKPTRFCVDRLKFWKEKWKITCLKRYGFFLGKKKSVTFLTCWPENTWKLNKTSGNYSSHHGAICWSWWLAIAYRTRIHRYIGKCIRALICRFRGRSGCAVSSTYDQQITIYSPQKFTVVLDRISSCPDSIRFCFHLENHCSFLYRSISYLWPVYHCCLSLSSNHHLRVFGSWMDCKRQQKWPIWRWL